MRIDGEVMFSVIVGVGSSCRDRPAYVSLLEAYDEDLYYEDVRHGGQVSSGKSFEVEIAPCYDEDDTNRRQQGEN